MISWLSVRFYRRFSRHQRDEIGEPVEDLKRSEFDDAIGPRPRSLAAATGPDPLDVQHMLLC